MNNFFNDPKKMATLGAAAALIQGSGRGPNGFRPSLGQTLGNAAFAGMSGHGMGVRNQSMAQQQQMQQNRLMQQTQANAWMQQNAPKFQQGASRDLVNQMMGTGNPILMDRAQQMHGNLPKAKFEKVIGGDGNAVHQAFFDDGTFGHTGTNPSAEKLSFQNTGREIQGMNQYTGEAVSNTPVSMSPGQAASLAQSNSQFNQSHALAKEKARQAQINMGKPQFKDGYWVSPPSAQNPQGGVTATEFAAPRKGSVAAKTMAADKILDITAEAKRILSEGKATASGLGNITDSVLGFAGVSSPGAQDAAKLKGLQGQLMMAMPRMEGPQSDKDVELYRQMAGMIGDASTPVQTRLAAIDEIERLQRVYASPGRQTQQQAPVTSNDGWGVERID